MIDAKELETVFLDCFYRDEEITDGQVPADVVKVQGITTNFGFHPGRLAANTPAIRAFVNQLPAQFRDGWSFLQLCTDANGDLWTGEHRVCEQLMALAIGAGLMRYCAPREMWLMFPGGVPYVQVTV